MKSQLAIVKGRLYSVGMERNTMMTRVALGNEDDGLEDPVRVNIPLSKKQFDFYSRELVNRGGRKPNDQGIEPYWPIPSYAIPVSLDIIISQKISSE